MYRVLYAGTMESGHRFAFVEQIMGTDYDKFAAAALIATGRPYLP